MPTIQYGLLATGFSGKPQSVCRTEMTTSIQAIRGPSFDCSDGSLWGQWLGIFSEREAALWDLGQAIDSSQDVDKATDAAQDDVCALTGTFRAQARSSQVTETLTGVPTTVIPQGTTIVTVSTSQSFVTTAPCTIAALTSWATGVTIAAGDRRTNAGRTYYALVGGVTAGAGSGPTTAVVGAPIVDNTVTWAYMGDGTGAVDVIALSTELDAIVGNAYDITAIRTPVGGLQGAVNLFNATVGAPQQSNESLRVTRENELAAQGTGPADAIRAAVLKVSGVTSCTVLQNLTDVTDGNGQQPHSVQVVVEGGDDAAIATVIRGQVTAATPTVGTTTINIADSQGTLQPIKFTRVTPVPIFVDVTYSYNPAPTNRGGYSTTSGAGLAQTTITNFGNALGVGRDVVASSLAAAIFPVFVGGFQVAGVQGILDVTSVKISTAPSPTVSTTIVITPFQRPTFTTTNITIHASAGSL
jgi:hypothetical protein